MAWRALALAAIACACGDERPPVMSCADHVGGQWYSEAGTYHALDRGQRIDLHPVFDSASPGSGGSAWLISIERATAAGSLSFFLTGPERTCRITWPAQLRRCADNTLELAYRPGPLACSAAPRTSWLDLHLHR